MSEENKGLRYWWVSFWLRDDVDFEFHGPWWVSGWRCGDEDEVAICLAMRGSDEAHVHEQCTTLFGKSLVEERFVEERHDPAKQLRDFQTPGARFACERARLARALGRGWSSLARRKRAGNEKLVDTV